MPHKFFTRHETDAYSLTSHDWGCYLLSRKSDGASAFFQGDDADLWERNMDALEAVKEWPAGNSLDQSFNFLCSGYDHVLETVKTPLFGEQNV